MTDSNRRHFSRIPFEGTLILQQGDHHWQAELIDISLKGMLIRQAAPDIIQRAEPLRATLRLTEDIDITMELAWRHSEGNRIGLACTRIDIDSISNLRRLVELNLGNSDLLERELGALGQ